MVPNNMGSAGYPRPVYNVQYKPGSGGNMCGPPDSRYIRDPNSYLSGDIHYMGPVQQLQRSHSSAGYPQRLPVRGGTLLTPQRSHSFNRGNDPQQHHQAMEMYHMNQHLECQLASFSKTDSEPSSSGIRADDKLVLTPKTTTSSVTSSTTVPDIVEP